MLLLLIVVVGMSSLGFVVFWGVFEAVGLTETAQRGLTMFATLASICIYGYAKYVFMLRERFGFKDNAVQFVAERVLYPIAAIAAPIGFVDLTGPRGSSLSNVALGLWLIMAFDPGLAFRRAMGQALSDRFGEDFEVRMGAHWWRLSFSSFPPRLERDFTLAHVYFFVLLAMAAYLGTELL